MGGGHHHHHHGGGGGPRPYGWGWGYPYPDYELVVTADACPQIYAPVLGMDGKVYPSACVAERAGVRVKKSLPPGMADFSSAIGDMGLTGYVVLGGAAYLLYKILKGK